MIKIYSSFEIKKIFLAGKILAKILKRLEKEARIGTKLNYLDKTAYQLAEKYKARPAFLGYKPDGACYSYGASICTSINNIIVHGLPSEYVLQNGDILKIDFGVEHQGFFADAAITIGIGDITKKARHLIKVNKLALRRAIEMARIGKTLGDIGWIIKKTADENGLKVIKNLTGHGIGKNLHEEPIIYNFGKKGDGIRLKKGMVLALEPMLAVGTDKIIQFPDESWATIDGSLSAHFEHTIVITEKAPKVLTML